MHQKHASRTRQIMLSASLTAVYVILRIVPTFQMVGVPGRFTTADFLLTSIALLAGLWGGLFTVIAGTILAFGASPPIFFGLDFLPATVDVLIATLLLSTRYRAAQIVYLVTFFAFILSPYSLLFGFYNVPYTWLHIVALLVLLSPIAPKIPVWVTSGGWRQITAIGALAFVGTMGQHLAGGLLFELTVGLIGGLKASNFMALWRIIFWVYPIERLIIIVFTAIIALAVLRSLSRWVHT